MIDQKALEEFKRIMAKDYNYHFEDDVEALKTANSFLISLEAVLRVSKREENKRKQAKKQLPNQPETA